MTSLFLASFLAWVLTILAPCVLPILPIILAGSIWERARWYPYLIIGSLTFSLVLFTVLLKASTVLIDVPSSFWKYVSGSILIFMWTISLFPGVWIRLKYLLHWTHSEKHLDTVQDVSSPVFRAIVTWVALGPVFSSCSPTYILLLATVFPASFIMGIWYTFVYSIGFSLMLLLIAILGRKLTQKLVFFADEWSTFKRSLGIIFFIIGLAIITWMDKIIEANILSRFDSTRLEEKFISLPY